MAKSVRYSQVPLKTAGGSYTNDNVPVSVQRTYNLYPETTPEGIVPIAMLPWPGLSFYSADASIDPCKFIYLWKGRIYFASGTTLYSVSANSTESDRDRQSHGTLYGNLEIYSASDNGEVMAIATGSGLWVFDGSSVYQEPSVSWNPKRVDFLNERFITDGDDGGTYLSDVLSTNFDIANVFYSRSSTDDAVAPVVFNQIIYAFGTDSIEPWEDIGQGAPPVQRINGAIIEDTGLAGVNAAASTRNALYFLGDKGVAYGIRGFSAEPISPPVVSSHFRSLDGDACVCDTLLWDGQHFVVFSFRNDSETWVYAENSGIWFEIGGDLDTPYKAFGFVEFGDRVFTASLESGTIAVFDQDNFFHINSIKAYERTLPVFSGEDTGKPGQLLEMSKLVLSVQTGKALKPNAPLGDDYPNPNLQVAISTDGGYTFGGERWIPLGVHGDYTRRTEYHHIQQFRRGVFRIRLTDPVLSFAIYGANLLVREAGE